MPFRSEKQRRFMYANHPDIARRWTSEYGSSIQPSKMKSMKPMNALAQARQAQKPGKKSAPKLGSGARFAALKAKLAAKGKVSNPGAVAASIGRKKYGNAKMQSMAAKGRK